MSASTTMRRSKSPSVSALTCTTDRSPADTSWTIRLDRSLAIESLKVFGPEDEPPPPPPHAETASRHPTTAADTRRTTSRYYCAFWVGSGGFGRLAAVAKVRQVHAEGRQITDADLDEIRNVCRCGTYVRIRSAVKDAATKM